VQQSHVEGPIDAFVEDLSSNISDKGSDVQTNMIIYGIIVAVVVIILAFLIIWSKITTPLKKLTAVSQKLSKGDIEGLEVDVSGSDKIGQFGESFKVRWSSPNGHIVKQR